MLFLTPYIGHYKKATEVVNFTKIALFFIFEQKINIFNEKAWGNASLSISHQYIGKFVSLSVFFKNCSFW